LSKKKNKNKRKENKTKTKEKRNLFYVSSSLFMFDGIKIDYTLLRLYKSPQTDTDYTRTQNASPQEDNEQGRTIGRKEEQYDFSEYREG
jgi:hypothetical protein